MPERPDAARLYEDEKVDGTHESASEDLLWEQATRDLAAASNCTYEQAERILKQAREDVHDV